MDGLKSLDFVRRSRNDPGLVKTGSCSVVKSPAQRQYCLSRIVSSGLAITAAFALFQPNRASAGWQATGDLNTARELYTETLLLDGKVLVTGGEGPTFAALASTEIYDSTTGIWTPSGSMHTARIYHTATRLTDGRILAAGGVTPAGITNSAEVYDPATGNWSVTGSMVTPRAQQTETLLANGKVL